jgi:hypothetical protein
VGLAALVIVLARRRRQEPDDSSSKKPGNKYKAAGGEADSDPTSMAYITMSSDPTTGSSREQDLKQAGAQAGLGRIGSPKAQATGQDKPQNAAPARTRPTTIVLPKSAAGLLDAIDVSSGMLFAPGAASDVVPPTATRSGPKTRAQQLAMIEKELKEIRTNLQVDDPGAQGGQKGKQPQGSGGQSSSLSSGDEVGSSSTGSDWIQAGAALTDHIPGLMLTAVLG